MSDKYYVKSNSVDLEKVAFVPTPDNQKRSLGEQITKIKQHPVDFIAHALKGEASGLTAGALGGAIVAAPLAMYWARKPKNLETMKKIFEAKKGFFQGMDASSPTYGQRLTHHLYELGKGETVGGGVIGLGLGMNKFFKKYDNQEGHQ